MNTNALKKFAQNARRQLLQQVAAKLDYVLTSDTAELRERAAQVQALRKALESSTREQLVEKVAYTWFNRLMALRFMDANDYQPGGLRVVSPREGYSLPQLLEEAKQGNFPPELAQEKQTVLDLLDGRLPSNNPQNEAYRHLLIAACNALHQQFPFLFERINDYTELLLPDDLTSEFSIVHEVVTGMPAEDCEEVEVIGWLYQFYISEKKDAVFASKGKVKAEDIPAATQLFTPRWIVEYMVQNTLGKLWLQNRPASRLREHMPYFIESPSVAAADYLRVDSPEEIRLLDQACGSGHILVYGFDLLTKIYEEEGYAPIEIPGLILANNLYGFEIDERAAQLASFTLLMKAREYYRRLFRKEVPKPQILCYQNITFKENELEDYLQSLQLDMFSQDLLTDIRQFEQATNLGSLLRFRTQELPYLERELPTPDLFLLNTHNKVKRVLRDMQLLTQPYHCVVDNPPYMGSGNMNKPLGDYVKKNYPDSKADLMAAFMEAGLAMLYPKGYLGMINQHSWMFLSSYEKLREKLIDDVFFDTLLHLGSRTFPEIGGEVVQNAAFTFWHQEHEAKGAYLRLVDDGSSELKRTKTLEAAQNADCDWHFTAEQQNFTKIPGKLIGYWLSDSTLKIWSTKLTIKDLSISDGQNKTGNNQKYLRYYWEIKSIDFLEKRWIPYAKGGAWRKWYGNLNYVIDWSKQSRLHFKKDRIARLIPEYLWYRTGITWSFIASTNVGFRLLPSGGTFDVQGSTLFFNDEITIYVLLGLLNSKPANLLFKILNPTISLQVKDVRNIPVPPSLNDQHLSSQSKLLIQISKTDWNTQETSEGFQRNEVLHHKAQDLEESYDLYCQYWTQQFRQLHRNEEELNKEFIHIYGLAEELTPDVSLTEITILQQELDQKQLKKLSAGYQSGWQLVDGQWVLAQQRPYPALPFDAQEVMAQLVSYAVGCMMGRYSLEKEGLVLANAGEGMKEYLEKVGAPPSPLSQESQAGLTRGDQAELTGEDNVGRFLPDEDAIIPVLDDEWFEDDIVGQFHAFLKASFGEEDFARNLAFLEDQLGRDVRSYFVKDFYKDHIQRYKKRPIYWLFSSPQGHFRVLVYLHRYTPDTISNILNNYLREFIEKLQSQRSHYEQQEISGTASEQNQATKAIEQLEKMLLDCEAYERDILYPLATDRIALDLDDGVLVNYNKLGSAVLTVPGLNDKKAKAKVRGFDWIAVEGIRD